MIDVCLFLYVPAEQGFIPKDLLVPDRHVPLRTHDPFGDEPNHLPDKPLTPDRSSIASFSSYGASEKPTVSIYLFE